MINNRMKNSTIYSDFSWYLTENNTVAMIRKTGWRWQCVAMAYSANCTQSKGNPVRRELGSVLVEMKTGIFK
jgi:hypothetical protein